MKPLHRKMTPQEYDNFPHRLGWKHEYYGGKIHVTPAHVAIVSLKLELSPRPMLADVPVRPVRLFDERGLVALFRLAFAGAVEYVEDARKAFRKRAAENIASFFTDISQPWYRASCVVPGKNQLLAAALVRPTKQGTPILKPLFVRPSHQRQGLATALMNQVVHRLLELGASHLYSHCRLANGPSLAWHHRFGFEELPDEWIAAHRARHYLEELERHDRLGDLSPEEREPLKQQADKWDAESQRLAEIGMHDFAAVHPRIG